MRRLNKILLLFLGFVVISMAAIWEFLQSDAFGESLSKNLNRFAQSQAGVSVHFENLDFQLFPPGANLNNVSVAVDRKELKASLKAGRLGVYFNMLDSFKTKLNVKEFYLEDAVIDVEELAEKKDSRQTKEKDKMNLRKTLDEFQEPLPFVVEKALVRDALVKIGDREQRINMASISLSGKGIQAAFELDNVILPKINSLPLSSLDTLKGKARILNDLVLVEKLEIHHGLTSVVLSGEVSNFLKNPKAKATGFLKGELGEVEKYLDMKSIGKLERGELRAMLSFEGGAKNYQAKAKVEVKNFLTDFVYGDKLEAELRISPDGLMAEKVFLKAQEQEIVLQKPFELYNFTRGEFSRKPFVLRASKLRFNNMLRYLRGTLSPLKASLSGDVHIKVGDNSVKFFSPESVEVGNLRLGQGELPIVQVEKALLISPDFSIVNGAFFMNVRARTLESEFEATGRVEKGELDFVINNGKVSLADFGPFAGVDVKGKGLINLTARGKGAETILKIGANLTEVDLKGCALEKASATTAFNFAKSEVEIANFEGTQGKTKISGSGKINYSNLDVSANGSIQAKRFGDMKRLLNPLLKKYKVPEDIYGNWKFGFDISGKASLDEIKAKGAFIGSNNYFLGESFEKISFGVLWEKQKLSLKDVSVAKGGGLASGSFYYDLSDASAVFNFTAGGIPLSEISFYSKTPFAFDGYLGGKLAGELRGAKKNLLLDVKLSGTRLAGEDYPDSGVSIAFTEKELAYSARFLGSSAEWEGRFMLGKSKEKSVSRLELDFPDIKRPLGLLKHVEKNALNVEGALKFEASASFEGLSYEEADFSANLKRFFFNKGALELKHANSGPPQISVSKGKIQRWNLELGGRRIYLVSKGEGSLFGNYDIDSKMKLDAGVLEILNTLVSQAGGTIRARARFFKNFFRRDYEALVLGDGISVSSDKLPSAITSGNFRIVYDDKKLLLEKLEASLSSGSVSAAGKVGLSGFLPDLDFNVKFKEAGFPIMKKSNLVVSGNAHLSGNKLPYSLTGEIKMQKMLLMNEITDFKSGKGAVFKKDYDYLPARASTISDNLVNMNIGVETVEPILLNNSLADVGIVGNAQIIGGEQDFRLVGKFSLAPRNNRVFFKSNEYVLTKANIFFQERNKVSNPELDIAAHSFINDYKVNIKVYGPVDKFQMELSSEPALSQEDVLSLIAFGYTEDLSANLSEREKESMTRAGVGSIIFDSFKINETLKNEFGLQVNLGTEIQEESRSYLSRVNNDSSVGKVSSATTIEVKKKLNEAMNLSVTSTVGGSIGQRQSMNLNYNLSDKLSVEGVYETRTSDEGEETINDTSLGADVKIRWSFR